MQKGCKTGTGMECILLQSGMYFVTVLGGKTETYAGVGLFEGWWKLDYDQPIFILFPTIPVPVW
jgi:hypothetical protein